MTKPRIYHHASTTDLTGQQWQSQDGVCVVGVRDEATGLYPVTCADERVLMMEPSLIADAILAAASMAKLRAILADPAQHQAEAAKAALAASDTHMCKLRQALGRHRGDCPACARLR